MTSNEPPSDCAGTGHSWPWRQGVRGKKPSPGTDVCAVCGTTRIVGEDGKKTFIRPKADQ